MKTVTRKLRGGIGNGIALSVQRRRVTRTEKVNCRAEEARKAELAAQIEEQAERDGNATRRHRNLVPARQRLFVIQ